MLCGNIYSYVLNSLDFTGTVSRRRPLLKQIEDQKAPRGTIQIEVSSGAPSDPCTNPPQHVHARSLPPANLRVCCSINASPAHDEAAHAHHLIELCNATIVSSHRLRMQPTLSLPPARIARLLTCLPHSGPLSLHPSPHSREDDGDDAAAPGASAAAAAAPGEN